IAFTRGIKEIRAYYAAPTDPSARDLRTGGLRLSRSRISSVSRQQGPRSRHDRSCIGGRAVGASRDLEVPMHVIPLRQNVHVHLDAPARAIRPEFEITVLRQIGIPDIPRALRAVGTDAGIPGPVAEGVIGAMREPVFENPEI